MSLSPETWNWRLSQAERLADRGKGFTEIGRAWGTSRVYAYVEIRRRRPALYERIIDLPYSHALPAEEVIRRCRALIDADGHVSTAAKNLGVDRHALHNWLRRNAPDGPQDLLMDYIDEEAA